METGLLIASPQMKDPNFQGSVVLMISHDGNQSLGVVINRPTDLPISEVVEQLKLDVDVPEGLVVYWGGPVEPGAGFVVLAGRVGPDDGWNLERGLAVSPARKVLEDALSSGEAFLLCLGYAGWGGGQLDDEIQDGSWLVTEVEPRVVLGVPPEERYELALALLGLSPEQIWMQPVDE